MKKDYFKTLSFKHDTYGDIDAVIVYDKKNEDYLIGYKTNNKCIDKLLIRFSGNIDQFNEDDRIKRKIIDQYHDFIYNKYSEDEIIKKVIPSIIAWKIGEFDKDNASIKLEDVIEIDKKYNLENVYMICDYNDDGIIISSPVTYNVKTKEVSDVFFEGYI